MRAKRFFKILKQINEILGIKKLQDKELKYTKKCRVYHLKKKPFYEFLFFGPPCICENILLKYTHVYNMGLRLNEIPTLIGIGAMYARRTRLCIAESLKKLISIT